MTPATDASIQSRSATRIQPAFISASRTPTTAFFVTSVVAGPGITTTTAARTRNAANWARGAASAASRIDIE